MVAAECGRDWFRFVPNSEVNLMRATSCVAMALVDWTEVRKPEAFCCCTLLVGFFWNVFRQRQGSSMVDLDLGLFSVLRRTRWKWWHDWWWFGLARWWLQTWWHVFDFWSSFLWRRFLGGFLATTSFTYGGSQIGSIPGCDEDPVKVAAWLVIAWINWMEAKNVDAWWLFITSANNFLKLF